MNKIMTMHEKCVKYDFVVPLTQKYPEKFFFWINSIFGLM